MNYEYTDKLYKKYALFIVRAFNSLNREFQALNFDELNVGNGYKTVTAKVTKTYKRCYDELIDILILLALHYFEESCDTVIEKKGEKLTYYVGKKDGFRKNRVFDARKFVEEYISKPNRVVKYSFDKEYERKLSRTVDTIISSGNKSEMKKEIDIAMRYWNRQAKQSGDNVSMEAFLDGLMAMGITRVRWITERDEKVCVACASRDGKIFDIDRIFIPLHYNCRCDLEIVDK